MVSDPCGWLDLEFRKLAAQEPEQVQVKEKVVRKSRSETILLPIEDHTVDESKAQRRSLDQLPEYFSGKYASIARNCKKVSIGGKF